MKICFLSSMHPPLDKRVFHKEARGLAKAGFEVVHLAPGNGKEWIEEGVRIVTYEPPRGLWSRLMQLRFLYRRARLIDAGAYHCNEVDSWMVGIALRLVAGRACVFDVHEHYPQDFAEHYAPRWLRPIVVTLMSTFINLMSRVTSRIVLAKASLADDFAHLPQERVVLVENFVPLSDLKLPPRRDTADSSLKLIHLGLFNLERGWPQLLQAMAIAQCQHVELHVVGEINDGSKPRFRTEIERLGLAGRVRFDPWLPYDQAMVHVTASDVGLILFQPGFFNHIHALPHKMFDYMAAGLAVIAPDFAVDVSKIVTESQCGLLVNAQSAQAIATAIDRLHESPQKREEMGRLGRDSVVSRYNWEAELAKLVRMYRDLASSIKES